MPPSLARAALLATLAVVVCPVPAAAAEPGFQLERYEPTEAGSWFVAVPHPWYSSTRWFAGGLTFDYGHNPLLYSPPPAAGQAATTVAAVRHQLLGHVDLAFSVFDRATLSVSLPVVLFESGAGAQGFQPPGGLVVGDPRLGLMVRVFGQPDRSAVSVNLGGMLWFPVGSAAQLAGDSQVRGLLRVVLAGMIAGQVRWSFDAGVLLRADANVLALPVSAGGTAGNELRVGLAAAWTDRTRRFAIGPEAVLGTALSSRAFDRPDTSLELLGSVHYHFAGTLLCSLAGGVGLLEQAGTPDARAVLRVAYAPGRRDRDGDGVADFEDACPDRRGPRASDPARSGCPDDRDGDGVADARDACPDTAAGPTPDDRRPGCPRLDGDGDGVADSDDRCPDVAAGKNVDPARPGCPLADRDRDGVDDSDDQCPDDPAGDTPDPARRGCPVADADHDGVDDAADRCPAIAAGEHADPARPGCPAGDRDSDGVLDAADRCPDVPAGEHADPARPGCPPGDRDGDGVVDGLDACPRVAGAPSDDPKQNGCPGLVVVSAGRLLIQKPIEFASGKDVIQPASFPVLERLATSLRLLHDIRALEIAGHTDNAGSATRNLELSGQRAERVREWLVAHGVEAERLTATGYGGTRPAYPNINGRNRALNRRVEFIVKPPPDRPGGADKKPQHGARPHTGRTHSHGAKP